MQLTSKDRQYTALVSPQGGSILQWQYQDQFILGPPEVVKKEGELKLRGVTHPCYPNFGKPPEHKLHPGRHGWLRDRLMRVKPAENEDGDRADFEYEGGFAEKLITSWTQVDNGGLSTGIEVEMNERTPVLYGLHPYFAKPAGGITVDVGEESFYTGSLTTGESQIIAIKRRVIYVHLAGVGRVQMNLTPNFTHLVLWSDCLYQYLCVEPVCGEPGSYAMEHGVYIEAGAKFHAEVGFQFTPEE